MNVIKSALVLAVAINASLLGPVSLTNNGASITISFSVSAMTDVEVAVIGTDGKVLRHLAAGVLGGSYPPPEPLIAGLVQSIVWDGKDDYGVWAGDRYQSVRVRSGVHPVFERSISTKVFGTSRTYGPENVDPQTTYLSKSHPLFAKDTTLYGEDNQLDFTVSDETDEIFIKHTKGDLTNASWQGWSHLARFNGKTGENLGMITNFSFDNICQSVGWGEPLVSWKGDKIHFIDCNYSYTVCGSATKPMSHVISFNLDGSKAVYQSTGNNYVSGFYNGDNRSRGFCEGPDGSLYIMHYGDPGSNCPTCTVAVGKKPQVGNVSPIGLTKVKNGVITDPFKLVIYAPVSGVRVDLKGNIYVAARIKPHDKNVPDFVKPESLSGKFSENFSQAFWADDMYGSILKFDSTGGSATVFDSTGATLASKRNKGDFEGGAGRALREPYVMRAQDAVRMTGGFKWLHYGVSHILGHVSWRGSTCWCNQTRFDVDRYGRVHYPNTFMHEVAAIDNNRNMFYRFSNRDLRGAVKIGLGHEIEATDYGLYVADWFNNQIAVFKWVGDEEQTLATKAELVSVPVGRPYLEVTPNPFRNNVSITYLAPSAENVNVQIFNVAGKLVRTLLSGNCVKQAGKVQWNGMDEAGILVPGGMYIVRMNGTKIHTKKIILVR
ncbi:MAG: T9SS type A sorting domain-containing protein [Fibrobacteres bacterium]|nr:T9SS type A sorting domain-containing protein [Fibrobacterota bacterium]